MPHRSLGNCRAGSPSSARSAEDRPNPASKILLLTAGFGEGHNSAARALKSAFDEHAGAGVGADIVDLFALRSPRFNVLACRGYLGLINRAPSVWKRLYRWMDRSRRLPLVLNGLSAHARLLQRMLAALRPLAVCSTYPAYPWLLNRLRARGALSCPHYTVVTDSISINRLWFQAASDGFFLPNQESAEVLLGAGLPRKRIHVTGFPVATLFADRPAAWTPPDLRAGAQPGILHLINSGRRHALETARALLRRPGWRLTFTAGRDENLRRRLARLASEHGRRVEVLGWTDRIPELLMTHHIAIGKAGGATTQETINALCPLIVNQVIPGQEEGNWELLRRHDAGAFAPTPDEIISALDAAFAGGADRWRRWRRNLQALARPAAARAIARIVLDLAAERDSTPAGSGHKIRDIA